MPDDELRITLDAIVARLQSDVQRHLEEVEERHQAAQQKTQRETEARVQAQTTQLVTAEWSARLEQARAEAENRFRVELAEASVAADRRLAAETARLLAEAEQAASELTARYETEREQAVAEAVARLRDELGKERQDAIQRIELAAQARVQEVERAMAESTARTRDEHESAFERERHQWTSERDRLLSELEGERRKASTLSTSLEELQAALAAEKHARESAQAALEAVSREQSRVEEQATGARVEERQAKVALVEQLMTGVRGVSEARSLSDTLNALAASAALMAPRVALFIVNERTASRELQGWRASGFAEPSPALLHLPADDSGLLATATSSKQSVSTSTVSAPDFAALPPDRAGLAVPLTVGGKTVAVLYADDGGANEPEAPSSWPEAMQILGAHASVCLSHITAVRTTQAMRATLTGGRSSESISEEDHSARRYARLLVSEIKLYNEAAVRTGREKRDLLARLAPEIDRARRLYEERIPASLLARGKYFQEELVHTLADGDAALLGSA